MVVNVQDFEKEYSYWQAQVANGKEERHGIVFGYKHENNAFGAWERKLCEAFLILSNEDRNRLRDIICDADILWLLNGYPLLLSKEIKNSADEYIVMLGLAALLIVDGRSDLREADHALRKLIAAAHQAGVRLREPLTNAKAIALSDARRSWLAEWSSSIDPNCDR